MEDYLSERLTVCYLSGLWQDEYHALRHFGSNHDLLLIDTIHNYVQYGRCENAVETSASYTRPTP